MFIPIIFDQIDIGNEYQNCKMMGKLSFQQKWSCDSIILKALSINNFRLTSM